MIDKKSQILDELLVLQVQAGNKVSFGLLVKKWHRKLIYQSKLRTNDWEQSEDLVQDVWYWLAGNMHKVHDVENFGSWIRTLVDRRSIDWIRKRTRSREINQKQDGGNRNNDANTIDHSDDSNDNVEKSISNLNRALNELEPGSKLVLSLYYSESNSIQSIARILNIPEGTVKSRLFKAREKLKKTIKNQAHE